MTCPRCSKPGEKHLVHVNPGGFREMLCLTCGGTNEIPDENGRRMVVAGDLRKARIGIGMTLRGYAKHLGVRPSLLSHIETGHLPTAEHLALWKRLTGESITEVDR